MPELENKDEIVDPVVLAAMIEDPDEDEDTKQLRKEILGSDETVKAEDVTDDEDEEPENKEASDEEDDEEAGKPEKKPVEAKDDDEDDVEEDLEEDEEKPKLTRKERRQERSKSFIDEIRKDGARNRQPTKIPEYKPVDYKTAPEDGFNPDELAEDRERFGATQFVQGAETVRYWAEQDRFWGELGTEAKILSYDPKLNFLTEETPDGKPNPNFDPDKTAEINEMYFQLVGLKQFQKTDEQGNPLFDRATGLPLITSTIDRTDLSYEKFARKYVQNVSKWNNEEIEDRVENARKNVTSQRKSQGVRPGGKSRKSLGAIKPGDISKMSSEELEKNEAEIERQILEML